MSKPLSRAAELLKQWQAGRTQCECARLLGIDQGRIGQYLRGDRKPGRMIAVTIQVRTGAMVPVEAWEQPALDQTAQTDTAPT